MKEHQINYNLRVVTEKCSERQWIVKVISSDWKAVKSGYLLDGVFLPPHSCTQHAYYRTRLDAREALRQYSTVRSDFVAITGGLH